MAKLERKTQKIFAGNGATDDVAAFGSMITGTPVYTNDLDNLQTNAYTQGWGKAIAANEAPFLEEMNGVQYGFSKQLAYLFQNGVPEWDENTTYYANTSFCQVDGVIYQSLTDDNIGNPVTDNTNWKVSSKDLEYKQPDFIQADKGNVTIKAGTAVLQKNNEYYFANEDRTYAIGDILDTGTVSNGKDYYFYIDNGGKLVASLKETKADMVQIGGAHTLCVDVGDNAPAPVTGDPFKKHPASGYMANDFIPNSSWTTVFHSMALTGNKGQALVNYGSYRFWSDIYLMSGTGTSTASSYAGTITNNRQYQLMFNDLDMVGKYAPNRNEFMILAMGSNQKTNIAGSTIPSDKLTGGYKDTEGKRMISRFFIECACGYLWQIGRDFGPTGGSSSWLQYADTSRGGIYGVPYVLIFGGSYATGSNCGSWSLASSAGLLAANATNGARGLSLHYQP